MKTLYITTITVLSVIIVANMGITYAQESTHGPSNQGNVTAPNNADDWFLHWNHRNDILNYSEISPDTARADDGWKTYTATIGQLSTDTVQSAHGFNIPYRIINGTGTLQMNNYTFRANTSSKTNGTFEIQIPRNFPYFNGKYGPGNLERYYVIENGYNLKSSEYTKTISDCFFTYSVPFHMNSTITILSANILYLMTPLYGDNVQDYCMPKTMVPEFPIAEMILVISIILTTLLYRIRFRR
jgi:hypothetical protein